MPGKIRNLKDAMDKYESQGNNSFFTLKDDKDTAIVRFLHEGEEDLDWYICHQAEINGKKRWVQCTEESNCPLCRAGNKPQLKLFLQLVDSRDGQTKTWERGQKFIPKVLGLIDRYGDLCNRNYEIERMGKKGDTKTDYALYNLDKDDKTLADLPERQKLAVDDKSFILVLDHEAMTQVAEGSYVVPSSGNNNNQQSSSSSSRRSEEQPQRRETKKGSDIF